MQPANEVGRDCRSLTIMRSGPFITTISERGRGLRSCQGVYYGCDHIRTGVGASEIVVGVGMGPQMTTIGCG